MSISRIKTWTDEILTAADLNAEFDGIIDGQQSIGSPRTAAFDMDGQELILDSDGDTSITADSDDVIDVRIAGNDAVLLGHGTGNTGAFVHVDPGAFTATAATNLGLLRIGNTNAATIPAGTTAIAAGAYFEIPNWTATGTITTSATVYIEGAATEGSTDYALWVDAGDTQLDGALTVGGLTTHGGNVVSDTDSTDDLGTSSVRWANLFVDTIGDTGQVLSVANDINFTVANPEILGGDTDGAMFVGPSTTNALGGNIVLYGDTHATKAKDIEFRATAGVEAHYDDSASTWDFQANTLATTGTITIGGTAVTPITLGTEQASTSGTSIDFTSIPAGTKRITIMFVGVSTSGTDNLLFQLGDSGGVETSGYLGATSLLGTGVVSASSTAGFILNIGAGTNVINGSITLFLEDSADFTWVASGIFGRSDAAATIVTGGSKSLSAELDRVRITTTGGTDTFDAGAINIQYE